jgi:cellulose synthase/poly-beta-1,6-N-acetylglucosamine synthase-like glycosyltransferase
MLIEVVFFGTFFVVIIGFSLYFILMLYYSRKPNNMNKKQIFPSVSLVIPAFNEEKVILQKLKSISEINYPREKIEILIVDDGSTDSTGEIVRNFIASNGSGLKISLLVRNERGGKASALNYAFKFCKGDIVIISDADVFFEKDSILHMVANFNDPRVGAVSGIEVMINPDYSRSTEMEQGYRSFYNTLRLGETNLDSVVMCESGFSAYRKQLLEELPDKCVCDDMELTLKTREKGFKAIYDPHVEFYEYSPVTFRSKLKQKIRRGQGNQQTLLRFAHLMFKPKYGKFAYVILPFEFFMHIACPILIPINVLFYVISLSGPHNIFIFLASVTFLLFDFLIIFLALRFLSPATHITLQHSSKRNRLLEPLLMPINFLILQICLLISLVSLILGKSMHKWQKIEETRTI